MTAKLVTIAFSHYCEKARWALARCGFDYVEDGSDRCVACDAGR